MRRDEAAARTTLRQAPVYSYGKLYRRIPQARPKAAGPAAAQRLAAVAFSTMLRGWTCTGFTYWFTRKRCPSAVTS